MNNTYSSWLPRWVQHGLGMLALLTIVSTTQAQPTTPVTTPTVTTDGVTNIGAGSATVLGTLTSAGSTALTDYGVVYVQGTGTPTTSDTKVQAGTSSPAFLPSSFLATLRVTPATTYTARAYATNSGGTSYGNAVIIGPVVSRLLSIERINSSPTNASIVTYAITFSIPVEGLTISNFAIATTGSVAGASLQSLRSLGASATYSTTYAVVVDTGTGDGTLTLRLANYTGTRPGIEIPVPTPGSPTYVIDKTALPAPTLASLDPTSGPVSTSVALTGTNLTGATAVSFNGTTTPFAVFSSTTIRVSVPPGATSGPVTVTTPSGISNSVVFSVTPTVLLTGPTNIGPTSALVGGSVTADGGTAVTSRGVVYSPTTAAPTVGGAGVTTVANGSGLGTFSQTITDLLPGTAYTLRAYATSSAGTSYSSAVYFTTLLTGTPTLITPPNGSTTNGRPLLSGIAPAGSTVTVYLTRSGEAPQPLVTTADSDGTFRVVVATPLADGSYSAYATVQRSGSEVTASNTNSFTVDTEAPTVTITSPTVRNGGTTNTSPIQFVVTFSEAVTGFDAGDVAPNIKSFASLSFTAISATTYAVTIVPAGPGLLFFRLPANVATDGAGNGNTAATSYAIIFGGSATTAPIVTAPASNSTVGSTPIYAGQAVANSLVTVYVDGAALPTTTASPDGLFSLPQPTPLNNGSHTVYATAEALGSTVSANSPTNAFRVNGPVPTVTLASSNGTNGSTTSTIPLFFTATFSERVTGFTTTGISVTNGTVTSGPMFIGSESRSYTFIVEPTAPGTATTVQVAANAGQNGAGNGNTASAPYTLTYLVPLTGVTWNGSVSTDWFTAANWTPAAVPTASISATIPVVASGRYPLIAAGSTAATVLHLTIDNGATLDQSNNTLDVRGDLTANGTFLPTGGTVVMGTRPERYGPNIFGTSRVRFWNLTIDSYSVLLHSLAGTSVRRVLTLHGPLVTLGYPFILESDATGTALVVNNAADPNVYLYGEGAVFGATIVQRYIDPNLNPGPGYRHFSSPVANTTVADFATPGFTPVLNSTYNGSPTPNGVRPFPTVFGYDQAFVNRTNASPNFDKGFFSPSSLSAPLEPGRSYDVQLSATELVDFVGTLNNGDIRVSLVRNASGTLNAGDAGWQLLGNPYPAPLDYSRVESADRAGLEAAIYVYSSTGPYQGQYRAYVNGIGNPILPVGQGFFARVATPGTTSTLVFRNSQRLTTPTPTAFQRTTADLRPFVQLELRSSTGAADSFSAYAEAGATLAVDAQYDAVKLSNPTGLNLAGVAATGEPLAVDGRAIFTATTVLPLTVGVPAAGPYSLSATALDNLPAGLTAYLRDAQTGQTTKLTAGTSYGFRVSAAEAQALVVGRFTIAFSPQTVLATTPSLLGEAVSVYPNPAHSSFTVTIPSVTGAGTVQAELVNTLGQVVRHQVVALLADSTSFNVPTAELAAGVYVLRLQAGNTTLTKRVVVQ